MEFSLVGGSYQSEALSADAQETVNLYPEQVESGTGRAKYVLLGTPGITLFVTLPQSPCRGVFAGDGRLFVVAGSPGHLYEISSAGVYVDRSSPGFSGAGGLPGSGPAPYGGTIAGSGPVDFAVNGTQLLIVGGGNVYCDSGSGPVAQYFTIEWTDLVIGPGANQITQATGGPFQSSDVGNTLTILPTSGTGWTPGTYTIIGIATSPPGVANMSAVVGTIGSTMGYGNESMIGNGLISAAQCTFLDSYFVISGLNVTATQSYGPKAIYISDPWDGRLWQPTNYAVKEGWPDNIAAIKADHEELWIWGDIFSTEIWRNTGAADFPLQRDLGAFITQGCIAPWSPVSIQNGVAWLGGDTRGQPVAWFASGFQPVRISNHAIERVWSTYSTVADAIGYTYVDRGHAFYVLYFPSGDMTWAWDALTNLWHKRGVWNGSDFDRQIQAYHGFVNAFGKHYVGSYTTGKVYVMDKGTYTDEGNPLYFRRTAPYIASEMDRFSIDELRLDFKYDPALTITLAASYDGGNTWTAEKPPSGLKVWKDNAASVAGLAWRRQGQSKARLFRLTGYGAAPRQLVNSYVNPND